MNKLIRRGAAAAVAALALGSTTTAFADPIVIPTLEPWPALPEQVPVKLPNPCPASGPKPAGCFPQPSGLVKPIDPAVIQALITAQVDAIAAAAKTTPDALLAQVMSTPVPTVDGTTKLVSETVQAYLDRVASTPVFDSTSNGFLGTPEVSVGNINHSFSVTRTLPATSAPRCADPTQVAPCVEAPSPNLAKMPKYSKAASNWVPAVPGQSVLGTSIAVPLAAAIVNGTTPAPPVTSAPGTGTPITGDVPTGTVCPAPALDPSGALCQKTFDNFKTNLVLATIPSSGLVSIQASDLTQPTSATDPTPKRVGAHSAGTGLSNGSNVDTAWRGVSQGDPWPIWLPLVTGPKDLTQAFLQPNFLADSGVDFIGFSTSPATTTVTCANVAGGAKTFSVVNGVEVANWPAQSCNSKGSFAGFGLAVYGKSPVNFRTDLAPLWSPAPPLVSQLSSSATAIANHLASYAPSTSAALAYEAALLAFVNAVKAQAPAAPGAPTPPEGVPAPPEGVPAPPEGVPAPPAGLPAVPLP